MNRAIFIGVPPAARTASAGNSRATRARRSSRLPERIPAARACTSTLPRAVASTGPASTSRPVRSAVSWQSSAFWLPPPTMCTMSIGGAAQPFRVGRAPARTPPPGCRRCDRANPAGVLGTASVRPAERGDPARHVPGRQQAGVVHVEDRDGPGDLGGCGQQLGQVDPLPRPLPGPDALAEQPQPHHVAEIAHPAVDAALVGEVRRGSSVSTGSSSSTPTSDQVPEET